jgi:hypothetical protein
MTTPENQSPGDGTTATLEELISVLRTQSSDLNEKIARLIESFLNMRSESAGAPNAEQFHLFDEKLSALIEASNNQSSLLNEKLSALIEGSSNQSSLLNEKLSALIEGSTNQSSLLHEKLSALIEGSTNQSSLFNEKLSALIKKATNETEPLSTHFVEVLVALEGQSDLLRQELSALTRGSSANFQLLETKFDQLLEGLDNQSSLLAERLAALVDGSSTQSELLNAKFNQVLEGLNNQSSLLAEKLAALVDGSSNQSDLLGNKFDQIITGLNNQSMLFNEKLSTMIEASNNQSEMLSAKLSSVLEQGSVQPGAQKERLDIIRELKAEVSLEKALEVVRRHARTERDAAHIFDEMLRQIVVPYHHSVSWGDRLLTLDKTAGFKADSQFQAALPIANRTTGQNQYDSPDGIAWRLNTLVWAARCALHVPGDYVECGVFKGDMSWFVTEMVDLRKTGRSFFLYDTFAGFSPNHSSAADFPRAPQAFSLMHREFSIPDLYETVRARFSKKNM